MQHPGAEHANAMTPGNTWGADQTLALRDGRRIGFRTHGAPGGQPLIFMHGTPGSRLVLSEHDLLAKLPDIYLITPDRPGYGLSTPHRNRTLHDWAGDMRALADHLGLNRYWVAGISGGAPHALACGYHNPTRVVAVFLLSSPAPADLIKSSAGLALGNRIGLWVGRYAPWIVRRAIRSYAAAFPADPRAFLAKVSAQMCASDRALMDRSEVLEAVIADMREAYRQGGDAQFEDGQLAMGLNSWGFAPEAVTTPVFAWHGEHDTLVPLRAARALASMMPTMHFTVVAGSGHLLTEIPSVIDRLGAIMRQQARG